MQRTLKNLNYPDRPKKASGDAADTAGFKPTQQNIPPAALNQPTTRHPPAIISALTAGCPTESAAAFPESEFHKTSSRIFPAETRFASVRNGSRAQRFQTPRSQPYHEF
jgi:hypothetical protein